MDIGKIVNDYFISPIWDRTGYNEVNTAVYAAIALIALYFIYKWIEKNKFAISREFWLAVVAWVVFGSSLRVAVDSVDSGRMAGIASYGGIAGLVYGKILQSHVFDYGFFTVTPGIYVVVAILFFCAFFIGRGLRIKNWAFAAGAVLALANILAILPMLANLNYLALILLIAGGATLVAYKFANLKGFELLAPVFAHSLDGAATWVSINLFSPQGGAGYFEQHVLSRAIGEATPLGFGLFFLLKFGFALLAAKLIAGEKDERLRNIALLAITVIGLAPGIRDALRLACGT